MAHSIRIYISNSNFLQLFSSREKAHLNTPLQIGGGGEVLFLKPPLALRHATFHHYMILSKWNKNHQLLSFMF